MNKPSWWKDKYYVYGHHLLLKYVDSERCGHPGARPGIVCQQTLKDGKCPHHDPSS